MCNERVTIQIRVSKDEKELLEALAKKRGNTLSDFMRLIYRQFLDKSLLQTASGVYAVPEIESATDTALPKESASTNKEWTCYKFKTTEERNQLLLEYAEKNNLTANIVIKDLLLKWLKAKKNSEVNGIGDVVIKLRPKAKYNKTISISLTRSEREDLLCYTRQSGHKLAALIDTLIDTYTKSQHDESDGV